MAIEVFHIDEGPADGPVVVLSGSIGSDVGIWERQRKPLLDRGFRVIRYDLRGHGRSPVPPGPYTLADLGEDASALLDTLNVPSAHWVGVSIGGMTGLWLAQHRPDLVRTLITAFTSARPGNAPMWKDRSSLARREGMSAIADGSITRWCTQRWRTEHPDEAARLRAMTANTPNEGYASCCEALGAVDLVADLPRIAAPTLVISGGRDPAFPAEHGRLIADGIPGARLELIEDAAHVGNYERADEFNRLMLDHIRER
ncbi:3-oxoadipate enol-lactonase [Streptomyces platensis]|uniref:3-oxoadipate enol-lactonase n=1 Tax=Streptomyces platensis TaxID=58346 RepID=UPI002E81441D|nr:3-oxoadipate enol-lactonase [Streptomyces platensis]WUB84320.1 3-oxoadipate enol-lactonase [Streptomyces platensis]